MFESPIRGISIIPLFLNMYCSVIYRKFNCCIIIIITRFWRRRREAGKSLTDGPAPRVSAFHSFVHFYWSSIHFKWIKAKKAVGVSNVWNEKKGRHRRMCDEHICSTRPRQGGCAPPRNKNLLAAFAHGMVVTPSLLLDYWTLTHEVAPGDQLMHPKSKGSSASMLIMHRLCSLFLLSLSFAEQ